MGTWLFWIGSLGSVSRVSVQFNIVSSGLDYIAFSYSVLYMSISFISSFFKLQSSIPIFFNMPQDLNTPVASESGMIQACFLLCLVMFYDYWNSVFTYCWKVGKKRSFCVFLCLYWDLNDNDCSEMILFGVTWIYLCLTISHWASLASNWRSVVLLQWCESNLFLWGETLVCFLKTSLTWDVSILTLSWINIAWKWFGLDDIVIEGYCECYDCSLDESLSVQHFLHIPLTPGESTVNEEAPSGNMRVPWF